MTAIFMRLSPSFYRYAAGLCLLFAGVAAGTAQGQGGVSRPVGYIVQTIPAGQSRSFSIPLDAPASSQANSVGRLSEVGENWFENADAAWTPGGFSRTGSPYFTRLS